MGNCFSRPNRRNRRDNQLQMVQPSHQSVSISISTRRVHRLNHSACRTLTTNKKGGSTQEASLPRSLIHHPSINANPEQVYACSHAHHSNSDNEGYKVMLTCHDKLITALAADYLNIARALLTRKLISDDILAIIPNSKSHHSGNNCQGEDKNCSTTVWRLGDSILRTYLNKMLSEIVAVCLPR